MEYKETLNLPVTDFPMRANLPKREPEILAFWEKEGIYARQREVRKGSPTYTLHDGPPYANGHIHLGHALNKILKDLVLKSRSMSGFDTPYIPGWDCHGLPIEHQVDKLLGKEKAGMSASQVRKRCRVFADEFIGIQRDEFRRLGILGDWENRYATMDYPYEAQIVRELAGFFLKGMVYRGLKPVHWCGSCRTALAEAEVEYDDHTSPSVYVRFPIVEPPLDRFPEWKGKRVWAVIWTTTPWTLPANVALAVHPKFTYKAYAVGEEVYLLAEELAPAALATFGFEGAQEFGTYRGADLEDLVGANPLEGWKSRFVLADHVTLDAGTGIVHTAPGHGQEDYEVGTRYGIEVYAPVDEAGRFTPEVKRFAGMKVFDANEPIIKVLEEEGFLLGKQKISHSYPHCWRCKKPVIFRATLQWFVSMETTDLRKRSLAEIERVRWIPSWGRERIWNMIANRPDWCISRQRVWGSPITVLLCTECDEPAYDEPFFDKVASLVDKEGADAWFDIPVEEIRGDLTCRACGGRSFRKETDIVDVWFDSGASHAAVLKARPNLVWPADLYLEGSDQHRGWFHSSLLVGVGNHDRAPYDAVLTHGFTMDGQGRKMSKSLGNIVTPQEVIDKYGADVLRLWVAAEDYRTDIRLSKDILEHLADAYRRIRNTARFLLGNLSDFNPHTDAVPYGELEELDRWALHRMSEVTEKITRAFEEFEFHLFFHHFHTFCAVDLSAVYLDVLKDRLYCEAPGSPTRRAAQTTLAIILDAMVRVMAPVLSFTAEEIWGVMPHQDPDRPASVHLALFPSFGEKFRDDALAARWDRVLAVRKVAGKALEVARQGGIIGSSLEAGVTLYLPAGDAAADERLMRETAIVSELHVLPLDAAPGDALRLEEVKDAAASVTRASGVRCDRCWMVSISTGEDVAHPTLCRRCLGVVAGR
jgi:isoleucyl-tRNA synthetase